MSFIPTPNGVKVVIEAVQNGIPIINVFHVKTPSAPNATQMEEVLDIFENWVKTAYRQRLHNSWRCDAIVATDISVANGIQRQRVLTTDNLGGNAGEAAAANAAVVISWRTGQTGRSFRGRTYMGALPNSVLADAQNVSSVYATNTLAAFISLGEALETAGYALCVLSKYADKAARAFGLLTEIIGLIVDTKIDSQRRRTAN